MTAQELKQSILASEGRTILSENICSRDPQAMDVTNSEVARAFGADLILLNVLDLNNPYIGGLPETDEPIKTLKKLVGRPVGVNLEPVDADAKKIGRASCRERVEIAEREGVVKRKREKM